MMYARDLPEWATDRGAKTRQLGELAPSEFGRFTAKPKRSELGRHRSEALLNSV
jgi:hypothetical protein